MFRDPNILAHIDEALQSLHNLGVSLVMDDFGTGYSSLGYLRDYSFDVLKIDRSIISDISPDPADRELTSAIVAIAQALKLKVVAEAVETAEQFELIKILNCDYAQGYLFSKAVNAVDFEQYTKDKVLTQVSRVEKTH